MKDCRDIEPLLTPYVDGEVDRDQSDAVRAHLMRCAPCRASAQAERDARAWLRAGADELRGAAPPALETRCRALCPSLPKRPRWMMPAAVAASLAVVLGGIALGLLTNERRAIASELSADHERCFARVMTVPVERSIQLDALTVTVPEGDPALGLELTGLRRCRIRRTVMAHALYRSQGRPVSLYVAAAADAPPIPEIMGVEVRTWTSEAGCYALVGRVTPAEMDALESFMRRPREGQAHQPPSGL